MKSGKKLLSILETLCVDGDAGVTQLAKKLGIAKSGVHRFLSLLAESGYVQKNSDNGKYSATLKTFEIGAMVRGRIGLVRELRPYMQALGRETDETVNLAFFEEGEVVYIDKVESREALRIDLAVGRRVPAYCTALGKVFLASLSEEELESYIRGRNFQAYTEKTIASAKELRRNLEKIRSEGLAVDNGEYDENILCIAVPVTDESGKTVAAISIAGPKMRMTSKRLTHFRKLLLSKTLRPGFLKFREPIGDRRSRRQAMQH